MPHRMNTPAGCSMRQDHGGDVRFNATDNTALEAAEAGVTAATEALATIERFEPSKVLPRAREVYRELVERLESIEDVSGAREALRELLGGEIRIVSEDGLPYAEMKNAGLAGVCQLTLVAGARFELATFGL